jgi:hypothetical protein
VFLTGHELTLVSSGVAAIAIVGGYLGVRSANRSAVKIAREERASKREGEMLALKRVIYVKLAIALNGLTTLAMDANKLASISTPRRRRNRTGLAERRETAQRAVIGAIAACQNASVEVGLITGNNDLRTLGSAASRAANEVSTDDKESIVRFAVAASKLLSSMQLDLKGEEIPSLADQEAMTQFLLAHRTPDGLMQVPVFPPEPPAPGMMRRAWMKLRRRGKQAAGSC